MIAMAAGRLLALGHPHAASMPSLPISCWNVLTSGRTAATPSRPCAPIAAHANLRAQRRAAGRHGLDPVGEQHLGRPRHVPAAVLAGLAELRVVAAQRPDPPDQARGQGSIVIVLKDDERRGPEHVVERRCRPAGRGCASARAARAVPRRPAGRSAPPPRGGRDLPRSRAGALPAARARTANDRGLAWASTRSSRTPIPGISFHRSRMTRGPAAPNRDHPPVIRHVLAPVSAGGSGRFEPRPAPSPPVAPGVALTFDDGPHPEGTPAVLEALARAGARATFFVVGEQVQRRPALVAEIAAAGHVVALHGYRHRLQLRLGGARGPGGHRARRRVDPRGGGDRRGAGTGRRMGSTAPPG